ncbi:hypothetical protein RSOLAG22IIIB_09881 [Rhizoctonia solani]|uniref:Retrotransposon gag domain-containing protein n=1 Tax=Rhizoctonia solani TaxID=456999 RepID=A0A0K6G0E1_9AGAM|nr:hypothetical protein RSOLAG22IIIB_09881 [Rhizoctonia solani]
MWWKTGGGFQGPGNLLPGEPCTVPGDSQALLDRPVTRVARVMAGYPWVPPGSVHGEYPYDMSTAVAPPARVPAAAGYPIGAVPRDSISRMVINVLDAHMNKVDPPKSLSKKGIKIDPPKSYDGSLGEDNNRVYILGHCTADAAQDWYHHTVELGDRGPENWTTLEVIQGLQGRFMTQISAADAAKEFRELTQGKLNAQELYEQLKLLSNQLPIAADEFTFAQRYMAALHAPIRRRVMMNGYNAAHDYNRIEELVGNAVDVELMIKASMEEERRTASMQPNESRQPTKKRAGKAPVRNERRSNSTAPGPRHIAPNCPNKRNGQVVAAKAANPMVEALLNGEGDSSDEIDIAENKQTSEEQSDADGTYPEDEVADYEDSNDDIWEQFNAEYATVDGRAARIVMLQPELEVRAAHTSNKTPVEPEPVMTPFARKQTAPSKDGQPTRTEASQRPFTGYFQVGNTVAHVLFDSGSGTDMISPSFVRIAQIKPIELEEPIGLQLATVGSRSKINYGVNTTITVGTTNVSHYFNVVNVDKYDVVLGTPFMRQYGVKLDFESNGIEINGKVIPNNSRVNTHPEPAAKRRTESTKAEPSRSVFKATPTESK